jgi:hypothetical protein
MFAHELFMKQIKKTSIELWQTGCGTLLYNMLYRISILLSIKPFVRDPPRESLFLVRTQGSIERGTV